MKSYRLAKIRRRKRKIFFLIFSLVSVIIGGYYFIFFSSFFRIQEIVFIPQNQLLQKDLNAFLLTKFQHYVPPAILTFFPQYKNNYQNILFIDKLELKTFFLKRYLILQTVNIEKDILQRRVIIRILRRKPQYLLCYTPADTINTEKTEKQKNITQNTKKRDCFYLDKDGLVYSKAPETLKTPLNKIVLANQPNISLGERILTPQSWQVINSIFSLTKKEDSPIKVLYLEFPRKDPSWINIVTAGGWRLKINLNDDFSFLLQIIKQFQQQHSSYILHSLKYLDLRFLPHIYYALH